MNTAKIMKNINIKNVGAMLLLIGGGVFVYYFVKRQIKKNKNEQAEEEKSVLSAFESVDMQAAANTATITREQAAVLANKIKTAWGFVNDNEAAIYAVFKSLKNSSDLALLINMYIYKGEDLVTSIQKRMSVSEVGKINEILKSKGITFTF